jgi:hypothetical protein
MRLSRKLRARLYYSVEAAGALMLWSRSEAYRAVARGDIPVELDGKFYRVPRQEWDPIVRRLRAKLREAEAAETVTA